MRPLAVDLVLLRGQAPDLPLAVGRILAARVVERHGEQGILNLAGALLTAELPEEVQAGDRLRLVVRETTADRVVLQLLQGPSQPALVPPPVEVPLPNGGKIALLGREESSPGEDGERAQVVTVRYEGPGVGTVELRVALDEALVHVRAALVEGAPLTRARERSGALRAALSAAAGRPAEVELVARPDPLDVYA
jgi:hypothetical protein